VMLFQRRSKMACLTYICQLANCYPLKFSKLLLPILF
jgi:hypothetical protein